MRLSDCVAHVFVLGMEKSRKVDIKGIFVLDSGGSIIFICFALIRGLATHDKKIY